MGLPRNLVSILKQRHLDVYSLTYFNINLHMYDIQATNVSTVRSSFVVLFHCSLIYSDIFNLPKSCEILFRAISDSA